MAANVVLDPLGAADVSAALALSTAEGWNQTESDWRRLLRLEPSGCFAARDGNRLIGTVTTTPYGRALAWIGMMIVHPDCRGKGIGTALMRRALDYLRGLGVATVKLDATPAGLPLYESIGFTAEAEVERWTGVAQPHAAAAPTPANAASRATVVELDRTAYGADRSRLIDLLLTDGQCDPLAVDSPPGSPVGFALARAGRSATYLGPVVATTAAAAERLVEEMLRRLAGTDLCVDLHRGGVLDPGVLAAGGLSLQRVLTRMAFGPRTEAGAGRSICASAGPEFG